MADEAVLQIYEDATGSTRQLRLSDLRDAIEQALAIQAKNPTEIFYADDTPLGYTQITVSTTAVGLGTIPPSARWAMILVSDEIRWRDDGTNPTASVGMREQVGLRYNGALASFKMIRTGTADVEAGVAFYA